MKRMCGVVLLGVTVACGDTTGPGANPAGAVVPASAQAQTGVVGRIVDQAPAVLVTDASGSPMVDMQVHWTVTAGAGSVSGGGRTGGDGVARAAWTLGLGAGTQTLEARVGTLPAVTFSVNALADAPFAIRPSRDTVAFDLPLDSLRLSAVLVDQYDNPLPTASLAWTSGDIDVLSIDGDGLVRVQGGGATTLSVSDGTLSADVHGLVDMPTISVPFVDLDLVVFFSPFGDPLSEQHDNVAYELYMDDDSMAVRSVSTGVVERVWYQEDTNDYEVFVRYSDAWLVLYDHLVAPAVAAGDVVQPGDTLGLVAYFGNYQVGNDLLPMGRIELQVNYERGNTGMAWCPALFGTPSFNAAHDEALARVSSSPATCSKMMAAP